MSHILLYGHTGSVNRGSEAIVKATIDLFAASGASCSLATYAPKDDAALGIENFCRLIAYRRAAVNPVGYLLAQLRSGLSHDAKYACAYFDADIRRAITTEAGIKILTVGGDTYCYGKPIGMMENNRYCEETGTPNYFWSCSIEKENLDAEVIQDMLRYTRIFPRESCSMQNLLDSGIPPEKLQLSADPAFTLRAEKWPLPQKAQGQELIGLNVSNLACSEARNLTDPLQYYADFAKWLLQNTDASLLLLPHVFSGETGDLHTLHELASCFADTDRVFLCDDEHMTCRHLKYLASCCRIVITARTHLSIAAYSTFVPTLVLGYSIKSQGLATDLFGTAQDYVVPVQSLHTLKDLTGPFETLWARRMETTTLLKRNVPAMQQRVRAAVDTVLDIATERDI